ncbi:MAG: hypothetical protein Q9222_000859 [Ikaeria aurantiellina]
MYTDVRHHPAELQYYPLLANDAQPSASRLGALPSFLHHRGRHEESKLRLHRPQRPTSYAYSVQSLSPLQYTASATPAPSSGGVEGMLRRKTPNGTLDASYDGRLLDRTTRRPASKHVLLPVSDAPEHVGFQAHARYQGSFASYGSELSYCQRDAEQSIGTMSSCHQGNRTARGPVDVKDGLQGRMENRALSLNPGLDSVLYQGSPSHQLRPSASGQQAPAMMQPMWPPCIGISTLNSPRPYGPRWLQAVPGSHRPLPVHDYRSHRGAERAIPDSATQLSQLRPGVNPACLDTVAPFDAVSPTHLSCESPMTQSARTLDYTGSTLTALRELQMTPSTEGDLMGTCQDATAAGNGFLPYGEAYHPTNSFGGRLPLLSSRTTSGAAEPPFKRCIQANNIQFTERVLIWAHRVYLALISLRHPARQAGQHGQHQNHRHSPQAVFPQPPWQTVSKLSKLQDISGAIRTHQDPPLSLDSGAFEAERFNGEFDSIDMPPYHTAEHRTPGAASKQLQHDVVKNGQGTNSHETILSAASLGVSRLTPSTESIPSTAAVTALELLSRLCHESGWTWIDGLLLGGCLAYALGDYAKALKWYTKVVSCDAK